MDKEKRKKLVKYSPEWYEAMRAAGRAGGRANIKAHGKSRMREIAHKGQQALITRLGGPEKAKEHFSRIGSMPWSPEKKGGDRS